MLTFGNLKSSSVINIAGVSPTGQSFRQLLNEATQGLMFRGDFESTVVPIHTCINQNGCVVWPRYVGHVRKVNFCNRWVPISNKWYSFLPRDRQRWSECSWNRWLGRNPQMELSGKTPLFQDILGDGRTVRAYSATPLDDNKFIHIFGEDCNGQPLTTQGIGGWTDGIRLQLKAPYVETTQTIRRIDRVVKDLTQGPVRLFAWNSTASVLEDLAVYAGSETNPDYERSNVSGACGGCSSSTPQSVVAMVKLAFVPVINDDDLVLIDNLRALKLFMQSIRFGESNDAENESAYELKSIRELNLQLADANPDSQVSVDLGEMGPVDSRNGIQQCF